MNTFGDMLRAVRRERGWSLQDVASRVGVTRAYISAIERGRRTMSRSPQMVSRLEDALGVPRGTLAAALPPGHLGGVALIPVVDDHGHGQPRSICITSLWAGCIARPRQDGGYDIIRERTGEIVGHIVA